MIIDRDVIWGTRRKYCTDCSMHLSLYEDEAESVNTCESCGGNLGELETKKEADRRRLETILKRLGTVSFLEWESGKNSFYMEDGDFRVILEKEFQKIQSGKRTTYSSLHYRLKVIRGDEIHAKFEELAPETDIGYFYEIIDRKRRNHFTKKFKET